MTTPADRIADAIAAYDASMAPLDGCTDGLCIVKPTAGLKAKTVTGCKCWKDPLTAQRVMRAGRRLRDALEQGK